MGKIVNGFVMLVLIIWGVLFLGLSGRLFIEGGSLAYSASIGVGLVGLFCIGLVGREGGLGKPRDEMPPENEFFCVEYVKEGEGQKIYLLLVPSVRKSTVRPVYHKINKNRFNKLDNLKIGAIIRNLYGTIEIVSTPS